MELSTSFAVISEGRLSEPRPTGEMSIEEIGLLMGGVHSNAKKGASARKGAGPGPEAAR
jgi:simple sugar transport system ATP-binding protein